MARKIKGRRQGSRNKGYFWRASHKAWYATTDDKMVPLMGEHGERLRDLMHLRRS